MPAKELVELRHHLHSIAEVSGEEHETASCIEEKLKSYQPEELITGIGGTGILARFGKADDGPSIMIRCELDALPIAEENELEYLSKDKKTGHKCGHDGHMAILCGVAERLSKRQDLNAEVWLLFQPAEENGEGAQKVLNDEKFQPIKPDYVFALHNVPGYKKHQIVVKSGAFAAASVGMQIKLKGETTHAAHPELGKSPAMAIAHLIEGLSALPQYKASINAPSKVTVTHARVGERVFGISPGEAELMATLRTFDSDGLEALKDGALKLAEGIAKTYDLELETQWFESFAATINDEEAVATIASAASAHHLDILEKEEPFGWSEDFGRFTDAYKGALFGLGSGMNQPALHASNYDFPDEIIETGVRMFMGIIEQLSIIN